MDRWNGSTEAVPATIPRAGTIERGADLKIEENGPETCKVSSDKGFVLVRVPVRVLGEVDGAGVTFRYTLGGFVGRESTWPPRAAGDFDLSFRVPRELFRERERFTVEVLRRDERGACTILWTRRREVHWAKEIPMLEPLPDAVPPE